MLQKIFYSVWLNVKKKKKPQHHWNGQKTHHHLGKPPHKPTTSHPATDPDPTWIKLPSESTKNPPATHETHCTKTKKSSLKSTKPHQLQPTGTSTPITGNPKLAKIKPKPQIWYLKKKKKKKTETQKPKLVRLVSPRRATPHLVASCRSSPSIILPCFVGDSSSCSCINGICCARDLGGFVVWERWREQGGLPCKRDKGCGGGRGLPCKRDEGE